MIDHLNHYDMTQVGTLQANKGDTIGDEGKSYKRAGIKCLIVYQRNDFGIICVKYIQNNKETGVFPVFSAHTALHWP